MSTFQLEDNKEYVDHLRIGFSFSRGGGGPTTFMRRLRESIDRQRLANPRLFFNPFTDINVYANAIRNPWQRPYVLRVDGISFDLAVGAEELDLRNKPIFDGIDSSAGVIFQAYFCRELVARFYRVPACPYTIIPNGVDLSSFSPCGANHRDSLGIPMDSVVFLSSAKWRAHKRLDAVIKAFVQFQETTGKLAYLVVLGALDKVPDGIPDRVHLIGHVSPDELPAWYRSADLFLFLSWLDYCPNTVVEALACGLPVVCTNQGGTRELVEMTRGGIVVEADAPFTFQPLELYRPPQPDPDAVLRGVLEAVKRRHELAATIDRKDIDIDIVARKYVAFLARARSELIEREKSRI
jgi:glycosyltransferase involved in cell wall biosynthesis